MKKQFYHLSLTKKICTFFVGAIAIVSTLHAQPFIYGATNSGGANGFGEIFKIDESGAPTENVLYSNDIVAGYNIQGTLLFASDKNIYGMTHLGGTGGPDSGVIFQYNPYTSTYTDLLNLNSNTGGYATGRLVEGNSGTFYGMTAVGGVHDSGVIFKYKKSTGVLTVLYSFKKSSGCRPIGSLILHNNLLYGMTIIGGAQDSGVIFSFDTGSLSYTILANLNRTTGAKPQGDLYMSSNGNLYGLTSVGGTKDSGTIVEYNTTTSTVSDYYNFANATGSTPVSDIIKVGNKIYGMTSLGGKHDSGTIFMYNTATSTYTDLFDFTKSQGDKPQGSLMLASNGYLYGMTRGGGAHNFGVIFRMDTVTHTYAKLIDFAGATTSGQAPIYTQLIEVCLPPTVTKQPSNAVICSNTDTSFTASGTASTTVTYQWQVNTGTGFSYISNGGVYSGATTSTLTLTGANFSMNGYTYRCVLMDGCTDSSTTSIATLTVRALPTITITGNPVNDSVCAGSSITLTASGAKTYVWSGGITNAVPFTPASSGKYVVTGTDVNGCMNKDSVDVGVYSLPTITITSSPSNDTVCSGSPITLSGNGGVSYSWSGGITNGVPFTPASTTIYTVTGTDSHGCKNTNTAKVVVDKANVTITGDVNGGFNICGAGNSDTLTAKATGGIGAFSYSWNTGGTNDTIIVASAATYTVTATDVFGCPVTANATVKVKALPTITITSSAVSDSVCKGGSITLSGNGGVSYTWSGGITNGTPFNPASAKTYTVTGTDANGCMNMDSIHVGIYPAPNITITSVPANDTICSGSSATLTGNGGVNYTWAPGTGLSATTGTNVTANPATSTSYTLTGTAANGCKNNDTVNLVVDNVAVTISGNKISGFNICGAGNYDTLTATVTSGYGAFGYSWSTGGTNDSIIVTTAATYNLTVTDKYGCTGNTFAKVRLRTLPTITITSTPANDSVCQGGSVTLSGNGGVSYTWSGGITNGNPFTPGSSGKYIVTGTDLHGCQNKDSVNVGVIPSPTITVTGHDTIMAGQVDTLTASGSSISYVWSTGSTNDTTIVSPSTTTIYTVIGTGLNGCKDSAKDTIVIKVITGINNNSSVTNSTSVYPNPASETMFVTVNMKSTNTAGVITVIDEMGKEVMIVNTTITSGKAIPMDISGLSTGVYFVKVTTEKNTQTLRFIKQ